MDFVKWLIDLSCIFEVVIVMNKIVWCTLLL